MDEPTTLTSLLWIILTVLAGVVATLSGAYNKFLLDRVKSERTDKEKWEQKSNNLEVEVRSILREKAADDKEQALALQGVVDMVRRNMDNPTNADLADTLKRIEGKC